MKSNKINIINEKMIFIRKKDDSPKICLELLKDQLSENKISKVQNLSDLTKIKTIIHSVTDEIGVMSVYLGNNCYLYDEDGEIKIKTMNDFIDVNKFETKFGLMITEDRGEWGGSLYNVTEFGAEEAGYGNFYYVFEYGDKVYAIETLSHLTMDRCRLHEIRKYCDRFEDITVFECYDLTWSGSYLENNYLYFYSNSLDNNGLYKFNLDNYELELIHKDLCFPLTRVNSLLKKENFIYIYGNYNLIKYDLNSHEMELFTNLVDDEIDELYVGRFKLREFWEEIFLDKQ